MVEQPNLIWRENSQRWHMALGKDEHVAGREWRHGRERNKVFGLGANPVRDSIHTLKFFGQAAATDFSANAAIVFAEGVVIHGLLCCVDFVAWQRLGQFCLNRYRCRSDGCLRHSFTKIVPATKGQRLALPVFKPKALPGLNMPDDFERMPKLRRGTLA